MNRVGRFAVLSMLSISLTAVPLVAQGHDDHRDDSHHDNGYHDDHHQTYVRHKEWHKGYHMQRQDWDRGERIQDWRAYHLRQPPRGYEWREVDGNYVMAAVATGVIASVIAASAAH